MLHDNTENERVSTPRDDLSRAEQAKRYVATTARLMGRHVSAQRQQRVASCGDWLQMLENENGTNRRLENGFFCGSRWCPACAWRYSAGWGRALMAVDRYLCTQNLVPMLVTLTVPNVPAEQLRDTLKHMSQSWDRLMKRQKYAVWQNFARKTEVTYNKSAKTYHPHYHALVWVKPGYFKHNYIAQKTLLQDWREVTRQQEITQVDIRRCRSTSDTGSAVAEVAKYVAKSAEYLVSQDVFDGFYGGLKNMRIMSLGGEAKTAVKLFKLGELSEFDPVQPDDLSMYVWRVIYAWGTDIYSEVKRERLDSADIQSIANLHKNVMKLAVDVLDDE